MSEQLIVHSFFDFSKTYTIEKWRGETLEKGLSKYFSKKQIKYLKKYFSKYIDSILSNSLHYLNKKYLKEFRDSLEAQFFAGLFTEILSNKIYQEWINLNAMDSVIEYYLQQRFYYAELALAGLIGTIEDFHVRVKRANRLVESFSEHHLKEYKAIWELINTQKIKNKKEACKIYKKGLFSEEYQETVDKIYNRFYKFMKRHQINTLQEYLDYLQTFKYRTS